MGKPRPRVASEASDVDQLGTAIDRKCTRKPAKSQRRRSLEEANPAAVYIGLERVGDLKPDAGRWTAIDPTGVVLGVFGSRREATRAILEVAT